MSISIFSTDTDQFRVVISWFDGLTPRESRVVLDNGQVTRYLKGNPHAWVTYN